MNSMEQESETESEVHYEKEWKYQVMWNEKNRN
jgi:hypothetical protein